MCLHQLIPRSEWPDIPDEGWAWKVFVENKGNLLRFSYRPFGDGGYIAPMDTLMVSAGNGYIIKYDHLTDQWYRAGFHMFLNEDDARAYNSKSWGCFVVKRVRYGGILEIGYENNQLILVTKRLMVPSFGLR